VVKWLASGKHIYMYVYMNICWKFHKDIFWNKKVIIIYIVVCLEVYTSIFKYWLFCWEGRQYLEEFWNSAKNLIKALCGVVWNPRTRLTWVNILHFKFKQLITILTTQSVNSRYTCIFVVYVGWTLNLSPTNFSSDSALNTCIEAFHQ